MPKFKLSKELRDQLLKRLKSLAWRGGVMAVVIVLDFFIQNAAQIGIPDLLTLGLGLGLGEVTKYLNR